MSDLAMASLQLNSLTIYRSILQDETVSRFALLLQATQSGATDSFCKGYTAFLNSLSEQNDALDFAAHLEQLIRFDDNTFSRTAARGVLEESNQVLRNVATFDLEILHEIAGITAAELKKTFLSRVQDEKADFISRLPEYKNSECLLTKGAAVAIAVLEQFYQNNGFGMYAAFGAFRWQHKLLGVSHPDPVRLTSLKSYEYERALVAANTLDFVEKRGGGNLLLYGDRGTGKSSTVKALANEYRGKGLRIVEVAKDSISEFPAILEQLRDVPLRFILFLDDLSFSSDDSAFSALKSVLEGGVVSRPDNCRIYATSNRRHLVKESFADRSVDANDVHAGDTMQEKLSLYDRFDQTVNFFSPDQSRYLAIVHAIALEKELQIATEFLDRGAVQWAIRNGGRSPRAAKQYVEWATVQVQKGGSVLDE